MITVCNNGESKISNIFIILITFLLYPGFLHTLKNGKAHLIRAESCALLLLAVLSVMRLVNRVDTLPVMANSIAVVVALGMGTMLLAIALFRIIKEKN